MDARANEKKVYLVPGGSLRFLLFVFRALYPSVSLGEAYVLRFHVLFVIWGLSIFNFSAFWLVSKLWLNMELGMIRKARWAQEEESQLCGWGRED